MNTSAYSAYIGNSVATASPARLLVMLFERLVLDVERAHKAKFAGDRQEASNQLQHAQRIVEHLMSTIQVEGMPAGPEMYALYQFLHRRLVEANVGTDPRAIADCLKLSRDLSEIWHEAALLAPSA